MGLSEKCYKGVKGVSHGCHKDARWVLQGLYRDVTRVVYRRYRFVTVMNRVISGVVHMWYMGMTGMLHRCYIRVGRVLQVWRHLCTFMYLHTFKDNNFAFPSFMDQNKAKQMHKIWHILGTNCLIYKL